MARRSRMSFQKKDRERRKAEKAARKRERRQQRDRQTDLPATAYPEPAEAPATPALPDPGFDDVPRGLLP